MIKEFLLKYKDRYTYLHDLGEGAEAITFVAQDIDRDIEVCIKLFKKGVTPEGVKRDWKITSTIKHIQIADTFTVENYKSDIHNSSCKAVICRFIKGQDFGSFLDELGEKDSDTKKKIANRLIFGFFTSLIEAVKVSHDFKYGHGDLHDRNVIISSDVKYCEPNLIATLIDFDNASNKPSLIRQTELERMESDLRAITRMIGNIIHERKWYQIFKELLDAAKNIYEYSYFYNSFMRFTSFLNDEDISQFPLTKFYENLVSNFNDCIFNNEHGNVFKETMRKISVDLDIESLFDEASKMVSSVIKQGLFMKYEVSMYQMGGDEEEVLNGIMSK